jgi:RNA polymerase sigma-70 factor (ECF subfamily)
MHIETELLTKCARGDEKAYRELVERLEKPLINFILRYVGERNLAEDLFQETFVRVLRNLADFRPEASIGTWIFTIARNLCLDHLKAKKRHREVSLEAPASDSEGRVIEFKEVLRGKGDAPQRNVERTEMKAAAVRALRQLAPAKREALVLRIYSELPYQEIARVVGAPVGTVKFRVHEALRDLAEKMGATESRRAGNDD